MRTAERPYEGKRPGDRPGAGGGGEGAGRGVLRSLGCARDDNRGREQSYLGTTKTLGAQGEKAKEAAEGGGWLRQPFVCTQDKLATEATTAG